MFQSVWALTNAHFTSEIFFSGVNVLWVASYLAFLTAMIFFFISSIVSYHIKILIVNFAVYIYS